MKKRPVPKIDQLSFPEPVRKSDHTRLRLVQAAARVMVQQGGARLTFEAVGAESGMNRAQVRYHYKDLDKLLIETARWVGHQSQVFAIEILKSAHSPRERLEKYVEAAFLSSIKVEAQIPVLLHSYERGLHHPEFQGMYERLQDDGNLRLAALLKDVAGELAPSVSKLTALASSIRALLTGLVLEMHLRQAQKESARYTERAKAGMWDLVKGAL